MQIFERSIQIGHNNSGMKINGDYIETLLERKTDTSLDYLQHAFSLCSLKL